MVPSEVGSVRPSPSTACLWPSTPLSQALGGLTRSNLAGSKQASPLTWSIVRAARDPNPNRQIRSLGAAGNLASSWKGSAG
jgi:hypothetical protein